MTDIYTIARVTRKHLYLFMAKTFTKDLCGSCAICSWQLNRIFKEFGYNSKFVVGCFIDDSWSHENYLNHAFVIVNNKIVDITATQFGLGPIVIKGLNHKKYVVDYENEAAVSELKNWPTEQQPLTYKKFLDKTKANIIKEINSLKEGAQYE